MAFGGFVIIDAQGQDSNGKRWRHLGRLGEYAAYKNVDPQDAPILDALILGEHPKPAIRDHLKTGQR
jgi:hypothetical protein